MAVPSESEQLILSDAQFEHWRSLIEAKIGIYLSSAQKTLLSIQLQDRIYNTQSTNLEQYESSLQGIAGVIEWSQLIDQILVQETYYFRHRPSFEYLANFLHERISNDTLGSSFDAWSVGCSTGEETYSLAMTIADALRLANLDLPWGVTGTDVSHNAIQQARTATYGRKAVSEVTDHELALHFTKKDGKYDVVDEIKRHVCFAQGNVVDLKTAPVVKMDAIFCQNLLIYFKRWRRRDILSSLAERLKPGGILVIGVGEIVDWEHPQLRRIRDERAHVYIKL